MSGEESSGGVEASGKSDDAAPSDDTSCRSGSEELMSISHIQDAGVPRTSAIPAQGPDVQELERRLRDQAELNAQLDSEVRYLLQELVVRKEFIARLEADLESLHVFAGRQLEMTAEFAAYRRRISHRIVDRMVNIVHGVPWLYRPLQRLGRVVSAVVRRTGAQSVGSSSTPRATTEVRAALPTVDHHDQQ